MTFAKVMEASVTFLSSGEGQSYPDDQATRSMK